MIRICRSLENSGFSIFLVGRKQKNQVVLTEESFQQKRLGGWFAKGPLFYMEYNFRLFFFLLPKKIDGICAIDLDTILPCLFISRIKKIKRVYDAHELFTEMKEVITRPRIKKFWTRVEKFAVPQFAQGYCVSQGIAKEFNKRYCVNYSVIRNVPLLQSVRPTEKKDKFLLYQGAVNEARGLEFLIPSMKLIDCKLVICGDGNLMSRCQSLISELGLQDKISLVGKVLPDDLVQLTQKAYIGINLVEPEGLNQYLSLANKFFDYIHARIPQVCMNFPSYIEINRQFPVAVLIDDLNPESIAEGINNMLNNDVLYNELQSNCVAASNAYNWQQEEKKLILLYKQLFD
jgi:glycosyltransferase involved in cell wall biosynthesis